MDKAGEEQGELVLTALVRSGRLVVGQCGATGGDCSQDGGLLVLVLMFFSVPYTYYIYILYIYIYCVYIL